MLDKSGLPAKSQNAFIAGICVFIIVFLFAKYRLYGYAVAWHCVHGSYSQLGAYKGRLPILWWAEKDPEHYDTYLLRRASTSPPAFPAEVVVGPALPGSTRNTDEEELESAKRVIDLVNKNSKNSNLILVTLNSKRLIFYCNRNDVFASGMDIYTLLLCGAARVPYSYSYSGPPAYEREAESILASLE